MSDQLVLMSSTLDDHPGETRERFLSLVVKHVSRVDHLVYDCSIGACDDKTLDAFEQQILMLFETIGESMSRDLKLLTVGA